MKRNALVTLVTGNQFRATFAAWFHAGWKRYCEMHGLDLIVIDRVLDDSSRAAQRSAAWQKCLVCQHSAVKQYDQVAWVDADIRIRPSAPNIFTGVPHEMIGAVDDYATPSAEEHEMVLRRVYQEWDKRDVKYVNNVTAHDFYKNFGLGGFDSVVQTGVLVFSPRLHPDIFQRTYDDYEDKGDSSWNYEMRPLSYEIMKTGLVRWISPKFNMPWSIYQQLFYPFLGDHSRIRALLHRVFGTRRGSLRRKCVQSAFLNNYWLHFAGRSSDFVLLHPNAE